MRLDAIRECQKCIDLSESVFITLWITLEQNHKVYSVNHTVSVSLKIPWPFSTSEPPAPPMHEDGRELSAGASGQASSILCCQAERSQALNISVLWKAQGNIRKHYGTAINCNIQHKKTWTARKRQRHSSLNRPHDSMSPGLKWWKIVTRTCSNTSRSKDSGAANPVPVQLVAVPLRAVHTSGRPKQSWVLTCSQSGFFPRCQKLTFFLWVRLWRYDCSHITCDWRNL